LSADFLTLINVNGFADYVSHTASYRAVLPE